MKKNFNTFCKVLFNLLSAVNIIAVVSYIIFITTANLTGMTNFVILFGAFITVNVIANVLIGKVLAKRNIVRFRKFHFTISPKNEI